MKYCSLIFLYIFGLKSSYEVFNLFNCTTFFFNIIIWRILIHADFTNKCSLPYLMGNISKQKSWFFVNGSKVHGSCCSIAKSICLGFQKWLLKKCLENSIVLIKFCLQLLWYKLHWQNSDHWNELQWGRYICSAIQGVEVLDQSPRWHTEEREYGYLSYLA